MGESGAGGTGNLEISGGPAALTGSSPPPPPTRQESAGSLAEHVADSRLETTFLPDGQSFQHRRTEAGGGRPGGLRRFKTETWSRSRRLGQGGFGSVWLEECMVQDQAGSTASGPKLRAVKQIPKDRSGGDSQISYVRELDAMIKFSREKYAHCFVKCLGWFDDDSAIYIAMEYIPHGDLERYLAHPLAEKEAKAIASQITEGLVFMHTSGFAHRDLKPANLFVCEPGPHWWIKIGDLGIAKRLENSTKLRTLVGTPAFLAPEVLGFVPAPLADSNPSSYTFAVDLWSLGQIVAQALLGSPLFDELSTMVPYVTGVKSFAESASKLFEKQPDPISPEGIAFIKHLLEVRPENRFTSTEAAKSPWLQSLDDDEAVNIKPGGASNSGVPSTPSPAPAGKLPAADAFQPSLAWTTQSDLSNQARTTGTSTKNLSMGETSLSQYSISQSEASLAASVDMSQHEQRKDKNPQARPSEESGRRGAPYLPLRLSSGGHTNSSTEAIASESGTGLVEFDGELVTGVLSKRWLVKPSNDNILHGGVLTEARLVDNIKEKYACRLVRLSKPEDEGLEKIHVQRNVTILGLLRHPNIAQVRDIIEGQVSRIMGDAQLSPTSYSLIYGPSSQYEPPPRRLAAVLADEGNLSEARAKHFARQIISAIDYCHGHNIVHGNINCETILVFESDTVKLSDFLEMRLPEDSKTDLLKLNRIDRNPSLRFLEYARRYGGSSAARQQSHSKRNACYFDDIKGFGTVVMTMVRVYTHQTGVSWVPIGVSPSLEILLRQLMSLTETAGQDKSTLTAAELCRHEWLRLGSEERVPSHVPRRRPLLLELDDVVLATMTSVMEKFVGRYSPASLKSSIREKITKVINDQSYRRGLCLYCPERQQQQQWQQQRRQYQVWHLGYKPEFRYDGVPKERLSSPGGRQCLRDTPRADITLVPGLENKDPAYAAHPLISLYYLVEEHVKARKAGSISDQEWRLWQMSL